MPKRNHHFIPKLYLSGFTESEGSPFIWEYVRGKDYCPGHRRGRDNPVRRSIRFAGAQVDEYAYERRDGEEEFDEFEDKLELLEKPSNPIFKKIRNQQSISEEDKRIFASYLVLLERRVPARSDRMEQMWSELPEFKFLFDDGGDEAKRPLKQKLEAQAAEVMASLRGEKMPKEIKLKTLVSESRIAPVMAQMRWQFLVAHRKDLLNV